MNGINPSDGRHGGENRNTESGFYYTYAAPTEDERRETESIRAKYAARSAAEVKLGYVKRLDRRVHGVPKAAAVTLGVVGLLMFGGGMALAMEGVAAVSLALGIVLSLSGAAAMATAKPVYSALLRRFKNKYGADIMRLTSEILGESGGGDDGGAENI